MINTKVLIVFYGLVFLIASCGKQSEIQTNKTDSTRKPSTNSQGTSPQSNIPPPVEQSRENSIDPITLNGTWVNPNDNTGLILSKDGKASSINLKSDYKSWKLEGKNLVIKTGSDDKEEVFIIKTITPYKLALSPKDNPNTIMLYARK